MVLFLILSNLVSMHDAYLLREQKAELAQLNTDLQQQNYGLLSKNYDLQWQLYYSQSENHALNQASELIQNEAKDVRQLRLLLDGYGISSPAQLNYTLYWSREAIRKQVTCSARLQTG